jgi:transposase
MRKLKLTNSIASDFIKSKMQTATNVSDFKRWQVIYLVSTYDVNSEYLSEITGYSKSNIYAIVQQHNNPNKPEVSIKKRGGRRRSLFTLEEESQLMKGLEQKALEGQILSYLDVKKVVEKKVNKVVSNDFIWDLFKRNGWTKHSPRPHHPKKEPEVQEAFKKNSKNIWMPLKIISQTS